jgi:two-component system OmpR family sensor kinase
VKTMANTSADANPETPDSRIAALQAELAAVRDEMQHFTYAVSHDLRAPLRHIVSYARLVEEDAGPQLSEEVQGFLSTITDSARHMGQLLDGLAALSRVGAAPVDVGAVSLQEMVQSAYQTVVAQYPQHNVEWRVASDLPVVQADPALLRQALVQVLDNAVKFSTTRKPAVIEINTLPAQSSGVVALQVRDNGVGFNPDHHNQLFKVFGRLHSSAQFQGLGMGLVLARKMLARMGGAISAQGVLNGGCCVELQLASMARQRG